jgi:hypothetical protein
MKEHEQKTVDDSEEADLGAERLRVETTQKAGLFGNTQFTDLNGVVIGNCHYSCREARAYGFK